MANRTVKVTLNAQVSNYLANMEAAAKGTKKVEQSLEAQKAASIAAAKAQGEAWTSLGQIGVRMGLVLAAGIAVAIARFAQFDQAMSQVKAATQETAENMDLLRDAAIEAGASTVFTATEAANAIEELGKAGLTTSEILEGGLSGALVLAAAGNIGVAEAASYAAIALKQFGLEGAQIPHVADLLAAGSGKAVGDVSDLAAALNQAGLIANAAGFSIEETTGVLAAFADAGLLGSDAGTSLKTAIVSLQAPTEKSRKTMADLGIDVYDSSGRLLGFEKIAGQLEKRLGGLTDEQRNAALATIFGTDAIRSANVLYTQGAAGIKKYVDQTNDSGYAAQVAADRLDNLAGDVEKLGGAFDTALIKGGSSANDSLRSLVQGVTFLVDGLGQVPQPLMATGLAFGVVGAAMLLAGGAALQTIPKIAALKLTLDSAGISGKTFALRTAAIGGALGLATIAVGFFVAQQAEAAATTREFQDSLDTVTGATTDYTRELVKRKLAEAGAFDAARAAGVSQKELTDALFEGGDAYDEVLEKIREINKNPLNMFTDTGIKASNTQAKLAELSTAIKDSQKNFEDQAAAGDTSVKTLDEIANSSIATQEAVANLSDELRKFGKITTDVIDAEQGFEAALDAVTSRLGDEGFAKGLDLSTEAGRKNTDVLQDIAARTNEFAAATYDAGGSLEEVNAILNRGKTELDKAAGGFRNAKDKVVDYSGALIATPKQIATRVSVDTGQAEANLAALKRSLKTVIGAAIKVTASGGKAAGGAIVGPGTGTSDTAGLYRLSNGEHVLTAADVAALGGQAGVYAMRKSLYKGYANGGAVQSYSSSSPAFSSSRPGGNSINITVPVTVSALAIDNPDAVARAVSTAVQTGIRNGSIPADWNKG